MAILVPIEVIEPKRVEVRDLLSVMADILRKWGVDEPVVMKGDEVVKGERIVEALRRLGARYIPVKRSGEQDYFTPLDALGFYDELSPSRLRVFNNTLELLYRNWPTPLVRLNSLSIGEVRVWAKLEAYNPFSNSVKDRIGWYMVKKFIEEKGRVEKVYEATSTNTGMAIAALGAIMGFSSRLYLPASIQKASDILLKALGAEVVRKRKALTVEFLDEVLEDARRDGAVSLNQFENDANFEVHLRYTAKELDLQMQSAGIRAEAIIGGIGTSGHLSAITFYFKNKLRGTMRIYAVQPAPGETIPGIRRVETGMKWIHWIRPDRVIEVTRDEAIEGVLRVARRDGILVGLSSGAVAAAFQKLLELGEIGEGDYVVIFPDNGLKYVEQLQAYFEKRGI
ncbi:MAG: pyridoxal-phosphate dependent enzyme [Desulfurococcales archaeon]|nr:pyridoxal-phosphate dependent enzyme [Desulfurococcales archaeon]